MANMNELLSQLDSIQNQIDENYVKTTTVMFTDLKDSTVYFEKNGDIKGRLYVEKHNNLLFPIIKKYGGVVIKTIGDAIMAKFDFPVCAVKASVEMQRTLKNYNKNATDLIKIRIGIHTGKALIEENDIFGDTVNLSARIEANTQPEKISISKSTLKAISPFKNIKVEPLGKINYKGKAESIDTYSVLWESSILEEEIRGEKDWDKHSLFLKLSKSNENVILSYTFYQNDKKSTISVYDLLKSDFMPFLNQVEVLYSNTIGKNSLVNNFDVKKFKECGKSLYNKVFKPIFDEINSKINIDYVVIEEDINFSFFPYEMLFDGENFLGLKYPVFRKLKDTNNYSENNNFGFLHFDIEDNIDQEREYDLILKEFENSNLTNFKPNKEIFSKNNLTKILSTFYNYTNVHFAFHNIFSIDMDKLNLNGEIISYSDIKLNKLTMENFVANSCKTVPVLLRMDRENNPFLNFLNNLNLKNYIGNFFNIYDEVGINFSEKFYEYLFKGYTYVDALFLTRKYLSEIYGVDSLLWASYTMFSTKPLSILNNLIEIHLKQQINNSIKQINTEKESIRGVESVIQPVIEVKKDKKKFSIINILLLFAILVAGIVVFQGKYNSATAENKVDLNAESNKIKENISNNIEKIAEKEIPAVITNINETKKEKSNVIANNENIPTIAILYFDNTSQEKELEPLKKGFADIIITDLSLIKEIKIVEREKLEEIIKELNLTETKFIDKENSLKIGKMLNAKYLLTGSYLNMFGQLRIDVKLINTETSEIVWTKGLEGELKNIFGLEKNIVSSFLQSEIINVKTENKEENSTLKYEAIENYSKALEFYDKKDYKNAQIYLEKAISADSKFQYAKKYLDKIK